MSTVAAGVHVDLQAKNMKASGSQGRWPKKSAEFLLQLLKNAESNAEFKVGSFSPFCTSSTKKIK